MTISPIVLWHGMEPVSVGLDWLSRTFLDLVCLEGQGMSGLTGLALHGWVYQAWQQYCITR